MKSEIQTRQQSSLICIQANLLRIIVMLLCFISHTISVTAQQKATCHSQTTAKEARPTATKPKRTFADFAVKDQNGRVLRFYSDLIKNKTVLINFIFTSCKEVCPVQGKSFAKLQVALGESVGKEVHFISVSTDPETDTPERLRAWGEKFHAQAGWTLVTGDKVVLDKILEELTGDPSGRREHSPTMWIGNDRLGNWTQTYSTADASRIRQLLDEVNGKSGASKSLVAINQPSAPHYFGSLNSNCRRAMKSSNCFCCSGVSTSRMRALVFSRIAFISGHSCNRAR